MSRKFNDLPPKTQALAVQMIAVIFVVAIAAIIKYMGNSDLADIFVDSFINYMVFGAVLLVAILTLLKIRNKK